VAQSLVIRHPAMALNALFVDTTAWYGEDAPKVWSERARQAREQGLSSLAEFQFTRWFTEEFRAAHPEVCQRLLERFVRNDIDNYVRTCRSMGIFDARDGLSRIQVPVVVLVGEDDQATPLAMAEDIHDRVAGSRLEVIPRCKHLSAVERPDLVAAAIRQLAAPAAR
jgi:3-oxoadipate enol-lactonase